jgi:N-glycosylase/DNA lyase
MELELPPRTPFNLDNTLNCGQAFRWKKVSDNWIGVVDETAIQMSQRGNKLFVQTFPDDVGETLVKKCFRLEDDLPYIISKINRDETIRTALHRLHGLRIMRQNSWECLISFICATFTNIPRIKGMIQNLCQRFGRKITQGGIQFYGFPRKEVLADASIHDLLGCNVGYRAKYIKKTSQSLVNNEVSLDTLRKTSYEKARESLLCLAGVGEKVADCVLLFSLEKLEAFPVDIWIRRILQTHYSYNFNITNLENRHLTPKLYKMFNDFGRQYFGRYAGYAQEYLYAEYSPIMTQRDS